MTTEPAPPSPATAPAAAAIIIPSRIPIGPVPQAIDIDPVPDGRGGHIVGLRIQQPTGVTVVLLTPDDAIRIGDQIRSAGTRSKLNLVIPGDR